MRPYRGQRWRRHFNGACSELCLKGGCGTGKRVKGVRAVAQEIEVVAPYDKKTSDDEIAKRAANILKWNTLIPDEAVQPTVNSGWITLNGEVEWQY